MAQTLNRCLARVAILASSAPAIPVIHSADWQIGKPYGRVGDPDKRARLRLSRIEAIGRIAGHCSGAAALVVAGDLFDSPTPAASDVSAVCAAIGAIPCPVLVIPGNHDHGGPGSIWHDAFFEQERLRRAPNLEVMLQRQPLELNDLVILPCPLLRRSDSLDPCNWLRQLDWRALPADKPRLVIAHGSIQGFGGADLELSGASDADDEHPANANNLLKLDPHWLEQVDYLALGDWHGLKQVNEKAWYSGTPETDRFPRHGDYRSGQVLRVELRRGQIPRVEALATGQLGWHPLTANFHQDGDLDRLERQLEELLQGRVGQDLVLLEQSGSLSLAAHQRYGALLERLEAQLLRLKRRGSCSQAPGETELAALVGRAADPLIAQVSAALLGELADPATDAATAATARLALAELHRAVQLAEG